MFFLGRLSGMRISKSKQYIKAQERVQFEEYFSPLRLVFLKSKFRLKPVFSRDMVAYALHKAV